MSRSAKLKSWLKLIGDILAGHAVPLVGIREAFK